MGLTFGDLDLLSGMGLAVQSQQLDELARDEYVSMAAELAKAFPNTKNMPRRYVPLVSRYVSELSGYYASTVTRKFGPDQPAASWQKLTDIYSNSMVTRTLGNVEEALWTQNSIIIIPMPDGPRKVRLILARPWQCEVLIADPLYANEPRGWMLLRVRIPIATTTGMVTFGLMEISPTHAWRQVGGTKIGIYAPDFSNPFGRIPVVIVHRRDPADGQVFGPVNQPLLSLAIALCLRESDLELLVHTQGWGQKVVIGADPAMKPKEVQVGPDKLLYLYGDGPDGGASPDMKVVQGQPPIAQIVGHMESSMRLWCSLLGLSPDAFLRVNTSLTASSRLFSDRDREEVRQRIKPRLATCEQQLAMNIADVSNVSGLLAIDATAVSVSVSWVSPEAAVDPLHDAQADTANVALGATRRSEVIARRRGISQADAEAVLDANIAEATRIGIPLQQDPPAGGGASKSGGGGTSPDAGMGAGL